MKGLKSVLFNIYSDKDGGRNSLRDSRMSINIINGSRCDNHDSTYKKQINYLAWALEEGIHQNN